jgi:hypothetical protein
MKRNNRVGLAPASVAFGWLGVAAGLLCLSGQVPVHAQGVEHLDQLDLLDMLGAGRPREAFELAFEHGDELFETVFTTADGVGAHVGNGSRFTRLPRADLSGRANGPRLYRCEPPGRMAKPATPAMTNPRTMALAESKLTFCVIPSTLAILHRSLSATRHISSVQGRSRSSPRR